MLIIRWKGGVGSYTKNTVKELRKAGHKVKVISREDDLKIFSFYKSILTIRNLVKKLIEKKNFDIICVNDWSLALPLLFPYPLYKEKLFCTFHGIHLTFPSSFFQRIVAFILKERVISVGPTLKKRFNKSIMNYEGADMIKFKPIKRKKKIKTIGFVLKGTEQINLDDISSVAKTLNYPLVIAKEIPFEKMNSFYNKCSIFMSIPPETAGFNLVWTEAMAAGVPIVIGNKEGIGSKLPITKVEKFGWDKTKTKEEKIKILIKTIKKAKKRNYRMWLIKNNFTWKRHANNLVKIWEKK